MKATGMYFALAAVAAVCSSAALADVKAVEKVTIDSPQLNAAMESLPPQQREKMRAMGVGTNMQITLYASGNRQRTDVGAMSIYLDMNNQKMIQVNRTSKTMTSMPYSPEIVKQQMTGTTTHITPTGKTMVILSHVARLSKMTSVNTAQGVTTVGEIWSAPDVPALKSNPFAAQMGGMSMAEIAKIKGFPMKFKLTTTGGYTGKMTISGVVTSLSTTPLPSRTFAIPTGYRVGGPVFPMGGGMGAVR